MENFLKAGKKDIGKGVTKKGTDIVLKTLRAIFLLCMCFVVLYPLIYMVSVSFRSPSDLYDPTVIWVPKNWTADNYKTVFETMNYSKMLVQTLILTLIPTIINVAVCAAVGYGFARFKFPFKGLLFSLVIFTIVVPSQTIAIPLFAQYYAFDFFGLGQLGRLFTGSPFTINILNTNWTFYIPSLFGMGIRSGLFIYIFRQFFRGMPKEIEEAAYIDGCGIFRTFVKIIALNAVPAFVSCFLFSFVWHWNEYYLTNLYFNDVQTLSTALGSLKDTLSSMGMDYWKDPYVVVAQLQAGCVITIMPLVIIFLLLQGKFTESIDKTGIVG